MRSTITYPRVGILLATWLSFGLASAQDVAQNFGDPLWKASVAVPTSQQLTDVRGAKFYVLKRRDVAQDRYNWLHGVALAWHRENLYATFGHNAGAENTASEVANGRVSADGGRTWSKLFQIDAGAEQDLAVSHGVLLSRAGKLWAFHGAFYGRMNDVHTRAYTLNEATDEWTPHGRVVGSGFWPMQEPIKMADGNWVMAGIRIKDGNGGANDPAAIAISNGDDLTDWKLIVIPKAEQNPMWGESVVIATGTRLLNIARYRRPFALTSRSQDFGRTWSLAAVSNLPMTASKPYAGTLSTGQRYLIGTMTSDNKNRRWPLTIAIADVGERSFHRLYRVRGAIHDGAGESHARAALSYPYAIERDGTLYIGYSNDGGRGKNRNSAELATIPIKSLQL